MIRLRKHIKREASDERVHHRRRHHKKAELLATFGPEPYVGTPDPNLVRCPWCGTDCSKRVAVCTNCNKHIYKIGDEHRIDVVLYELNKRLYAALHDNDAGEIVRLRASIKAMVAKTGHIFRVGADGEATQVRTTVVPRKGGARKPKPTRLCPCCGQVTNNGAYFLNTHAIRILGMFRRVDAGKVCVMDLPEALLEMYEMRDRHPEVTVLRDLAVMVETEKVTKLARAAKGESKKT